MVLPGEMVKCSARIEVCQMLCTQKALPATFVSSGKIVIPADYLPTCVRSCQACVQHTTAEPMVFTQKVVMIDDEPELLRCRPLFARLVALGHSSVLLRRQYRCTPRSACPEWSLHGLLACPGAHGLNLLGHRKHPAIYTAAISALQLT